MVRKLTEEQKNILLGSTWGVFQQYFNPILDANGNWIISEEEVQGCTLSIANQIGCADWLLTLPIIEYNPILINNSNK